MMLLRVFADRHGALTADWVCNDLPTLPSSSVVTTSAYRFRALLVKGGAELELTWF